MTEANLVSADISTTFVSDREFAELMSGFFDGQEPPNLAIAVSGGGDSMALSLLTACWAKQRNVSVTALTVDHQLRSEAKAEARQVGGWMKSIGLPHQILLWTGGEKMRCLAKSPQSSARDARLNLMTDWCRSNNTKHLLLGHAADDQIETFLINLSRGSGIDGLSAISSTSLRNSIHLLRPLLSIPRSRLKKTCFVHKQLWISDPSNLDSAFTRIRFRQSQAMLESEGLTQNRLLNTVCHLSRAKAALDYYVRSTLKATCRISSCGTLEVDIKSLIEAPAEIALRCISRMLITVSGQVYGPRFERLRRAYDKFCSGDWRGQTLHGCRIERRRDALVIYREVGAIEHRCVIEANQTVLWDNRFRIHYAPTSRGSSSINVSALTSGEWSALKEVNDSDIDSSYGADQRQTVPIISDSLGIVGVPILGVWWPGTTDSTKKAISMTFDPPRALLPNNNA